jgi:hypothetical protein
VRGKGGKEENPREKIEKPPRSKACRKRVDNMVLEHRRMTVFVAHLIVVTAYADLRGRPRPRLGRVALAAPFGSCAGLKSGYLAM